MYQKLFAAQEEIFKVLANQKRLEIIQLLNDQELSVTQIGDMLGMSQSNLSQHLSHLRQAKLVLARRDGQTIYYSLVDSRISQACNLIKDVLRDGHSLSDGEKKFLNSQEAIFPAVKDVVCGMRISLPRAADFTEYEGSHYYFCGSGCKQMFGTDPKSYIK